MSFMVKKKRYKFQVNFTLEELSSVPFVSGVIFAKVRLQDGGSFTEASSREEVSHHCVKWNANFKFQCKLNANASNGVLETCICRVSVRKEVKGGKSFQKLGFADINLAEFAGAGYSTRKYLLEGYDSKHRLDNSTIKVTINMTLLSGDPLFKVPSVQKLGLPGESCDDDLRLENKGLGEVEELETREEEEKLSNAASSGFGSLTRHKKASPDLGSKESSKHGHSRSGSYTSAGYASNQSHSRQSSATALELSHARNPSNGSSRSDPGKRRRIDPDRLNKERIDSTRVNADDLVNELVEGLHIEDSDTAEVSGLQLYVAKDGTTALGSHEIKNSLTPGSFQAVVFDQRR